MFDHDRLPRRLVASVTRAIGEQFNPKRHH